MGFQGQLQKILIVEDNKDIRKLIRDIIESNFNVSIIEAQDGVEANWKLANECIDILITDLKMPKVSGIELIISLKKNPTIYQPKYIVVISGAVDEKMAQTFSERGLKTIAKPIDSTVLIEFLNVIGVRSITDDQGELVEEMANTKKKLYQRKSA